MGNTTPDPIVSIVDGSAMSTQAIQIAADSAGLNLEVFESAQRFLDTVDPCRPGCIVIRSDLPHIAGFAPYHHILMRPGHAPLILRCGKREATTIVHAISLGAFEVIDLQSGMDELISLVAQGVARDAQARVQEKRLNEFEGRFSLLSSEELVVFGLVAAGKLNKQIEAMLGVKRRTVEDRRARVMRKLNVKTVPELVEFAVQLGR